MSETIETSTLSLSAQLESLLFVAPEPVSTGQLAAALNTTTYQVEKGLEELRTELASRGIRLQKYGGKYQLTSAPEAGEQVELFLGLESTARLSSAAIETMAIIAYEQPVTRPQIDAVRGVNSDGVLRSLLRKGLVEEVGRSDAVGRPILYGTTAEFLQQFGLPSLEELPPLIPDEELDSLEEEVSDKDNTEAAEENKD